MTTTFRIVRWYHGDGEAAGTAKGWMVTATNGTASFPTRAAASRVARRLQARFDEQDMITHELVDDTGRCVPLLFPRHTNNEIPF